MPSTRQEQREAKRPVTVPFSKTMHWPASMVGAETPASRHGIRYLGGFSYRGQANTLARKLMAERGHLFALAELEIQRELALERYKKKARRIKVVA